MSSVCEHAVSEQWRPIPGAEGYYCVSDQGRIRSEPLAHKTLGKQRGRILSPSLDTKGYRIFKLCIPGRRQKTTKVHRVVARVFLGEPPDGAQVNHKNGVKTDNRADNLEYVTCRENIRHCWRNGLHGVEHARGEANHNTTLCADEVRTIRELYPHCSLGRLARAFGISPTAVSCIVKRRTWKHV
jgi:hypothetical protein